MKSISKLIVAGLSLVVTLGAFAVPQTPLKNSNAKVGDSPYNYRTKLGSINAKHYSALEGLSKRDAKKGTPVASPKHLKKPASVLPSLNAPALLPASSAPLIGISIDSDDNVASPSGIYSMSSTAASTDMELLVEDSEISTAVNAFLYGGKYYVSCLQTFLGYIFGGSHMVFDIDSWEMVSYEECDLYADDFMTQFALGTTFDKTDGKVYGVFYNADVTGYNFGVQNPETWEVDVIGEVDIVVNSIAAAPDGTLYVIDSDGYLYTINKANAELTLIGDTGYEPYYLSAATIDPMTGVMYWTLSPLDDAGYLLTVDTNTGAADMLYEYDYNNEVVGLTIAAPDVAEGAPAAPENLTLAFDGDLCTGAISFNMPGATFDGAPLVGTCHYVITRNDEVIKEGESLSNLPVKYYDVVPARGYYKYAVYASNEVGAGPKAQVKQWIGPDAPEAPTDVNLEYVDGQYIVSWNPVESTVNSGADVEDVTYRVRLYANDAMVIFDGEVENNVIAYEGDAPETLTVFFATVQAVTSRTVSELGVSNSIALGSIVPPFREEFDSYDSLAKYTILDENYDGFTWQIITPGVARVLYNYDGETAMDDWMVTPAINLEAGKEYTFSMSAAAGSSYYPERIEVMMGTEPTADGMTTVLVDPTDLTTNEYQKFSSTFVCEESGEYYIGIHGCSDADELYLYLDYFAISAGVSGDAPAAPEVSVVANPTGALNATVTYTVPSKTVNGDDTQISKVVVSLNGLEYAVNKKVEAGEVCTQEIVVSEAGAYEIGVTAYNGAGIGRTASVSTFIGINRPGVPTNVVVKGDANDEIVVTWDAPATDINGYPIAADLITYNVLNSDYDYVAIATPETTCSYSIDTDTPGFTYCQVQAETEAGVSPSQAVSNMWPIGPAASLPMVESFDNGNLSYPMGLEDGGASVYILTQNDIDLPDFDGTDGMVAFEGEFIGDWAELFTAKIDLDAKAPVVSLAYYCLASDDENILEISVKDLATNEQSLVKTVELSKGIVGSWNNVMVPVDAYAGKTVQILLKGTVLAYPYIFIDALKVYEPLEIDLCASAINAPAMVAPGQEFDVVVNVQNMGIKDVTSYTVELLNNGVSVAKIDAKALASGVMAQHTFTTSLSAISSVSNLYSAKVVCDGDLDTDNNVSAVAPVLLDVPNFPIATGLTATAAQTGVALSWAEPNLDPANLPKEAVTDDFESYEAFTYTDLGEWTLYDEDCMEIGGVQGVNFPGITVGESLVAYFVMNTDEAGLSANANYAAHSGVQYLVSTFPYNTGQALDWLISPALTGDAQNISFYARSFSSSYPESIQVLYSTTDREPESFEVAAEYDNIAADWTRYSVNLPAGAKYFAIRNISYDAFMLFVDDVTYIPANGKPMELSLVGYNIYRNGVKINAEPVAETSYVDAEGSANDVYNVTVVYAEGESAASEAASVAGANVSGINGAVASAAKVSVQGRTIVITGAEGLVNVFTADGKMIYNAAADTRNAVTVVPGVYVVNNGKNVQKVVVK